MGDLRKVFMGERPPREGRTMHVEVDTALNASQQAAVQFALAAEDIAVIHGPPGTGKTTTVVEVIRQLVKADQQVLALLSNTAVDNLLERLLATGANAVRLGHPARVAADLRDHTLDALVQNHPETRLVRDLMRKAENLFRKASRSLARNRRHAKQEMCQAGRQLKSDARRLERQIVQQILNQADVVCSTTALDDELLGDRQFPWVVIDERVKIPNRAAGSCYSVPNVLSWQVIIASYLPRSSRHRRPKRVWRESSDRTVQQYQERVNPLTRCPVLDHERIMQFSSRHFYDGQLQADATVREHRLSELTDVSVSGVLDEPVTFLDTAGMGWQEEQEPDGQSRLNPGEAECVLKKVDQLVSAGLNPRDIAVIAPYAAQVCYLASVWRDVSSRGGHG